MNKKSIAAAVSAIIISTSVNAAVIDTFEDIGANGTVINNRIIDGVTVSLSTNTGAKFSAATYFSGLFAFAGQPGAMNNPLVPSNVSGSRFISTQVNVVPLSDTLKLNFNFSEGISEFGFTMLDFEIGMGELTAYDSNDNVVDSFTYGYTGAYDPANSGVDTDWLVTSVNGNISYAIFSTVGANSGGGYGIDDMLVSSVPVPGAVWLFGSGLLSLIGFTKRKLK